MNKRLSLKKETLTRLDTGELAEIVGGTATFTCTYSQGDSCGGVCSGYCPSYNCPAEAVLNLVTGTIN